MRTSGFLHTSPTNQHVPPPLSLLNMERVLKLKRCSFGGQLGPSEGSTPASRRTTRCSTAGQERPRSAFGEAPDNTAGILNKALQLGTTLPLCAAAQAATILTIAPTGTPTPAIGPATPDIAVDEEASTSDQCCAIRTEELPHASPVATSASAASDCSAGEGGEDDLSSCASRTTRSSNGASGEETDLSSAASEVVAGDVDGNWDDLASLPTISSDSSVDEEIQSHTSCDVFTLDILSMMKAIVSDLEVAPPAPVAPEAADLPTRDLDLELETIRAAERTYGPHPSPCALQIAVHLNIPAIASVLLCPARMSVALAPPNRGFCLKSGTQRSKRSCFGA
eukprot:jgi/Ulvmu1/8318/UM042_0024.1